MGVPKTCQAPRQAWIMKHTAGCWWSKVWRPLGLQWVAVKHGTFFAKNVGYLTKFWTPDSQNLTPGLKKSSFGAGFLPSTVCPLVCISYKPPGIAGTTLLIAGTALMMPKCDRLDPATVLEALNEAYVPWQTMVGVDIPHVIGGNPGYDNSTYYWLFIPRITPQICFKW